MIQHFEKEKKKTSGACLDARLGREQGDHVVQDGSDVEGDGLHLQLAGFDLRPIKHFVYERYQGLAADLSGLGVVLLGRAELRV